MPLLAIEGLSVRFGADAQRLIAVDDLTLSVDEGEIVGIVG
jgi:ABC-type glutathione transport system ATPase component